MKQAIPTSVSRANSGIAEELLLRLFGLYRLPIPSLIQPSRNFPSSFCSASYNEKFSTIPGSISRPSAKLLISNNMEVNSEPESMKFVSLKNLNQKLGEPLLPKCSFTVAGEIKQEGPHFEDSDICSSVHSARVQVRDPQKPEANREFVARRRVVIARDGASVLPYFQSKDQWKVVLIEQFRIAVGKSTLEAPGGVVENEENVLKTMVRELAEEAGLDVSPDQIELRFREIYLPSLLNGRAWGGIVKIDLERYPDLEKPTLIRERDSGRDSYTVRRVFFLDEIMALRGSNNLDVIDLWTSRLIQEVAVVTGGT